MSSKTAPARKQTRARPRARRADAERSVAAILDAATDALGADPDATMADIARRAIAGLSLPVVSSQCAELPV